MTSAELAAFRRSINPRWFPYAERMEREQGFPNRTQRAWGIPVRNGMDHLSSKARREASAMRSRAYAADASFQILAGDPGWEV